MNSVELPEMLQIYTRNIRAQKNISSLVLDSKDIEIGWI